MSSPFRTCRCILAGFFVVGVAHALIANDPSTWLHHRAVPSPINYSCKVNSKGSHARRRSLQTTLYEGGKGDTTGPKNQSTAKNEFSRTIRVSNWFSGGGGGSSSSSRRKRVMDLSISATSEERHALATRFRLTNISSLSAELVVQPAILGRDRSGSGGGGSSSNVEDNECIEARGTVCAEVTQTCVRTNEDFDVTLEFSFDTVLRAMSSTSGSSSASKDDVETAPLSLGELAALEAAAKLGGGEKPRKKKKGGNKQRGVKGVRGGQSSRDLDGIGMKQLQDVLMEYEVTEDIIEDESCFCTDGIVDCGEIVAQMFRSKLDPYPKKPGSVSDATMLMRIIWKI